MLNRLKFLIISVLYRRLLKPILFLQDPEKVHDKFTKVGVFLGRFKCTKWIIRIFLNYRHPILKQRLAGIDFQTPIGLSAGFDKNGHLTQILPDLGFGFMQIGSITAKPYAGNPKPRLYRLKKSRALIVYYGLKNDGVKEIIKRLSKNKKTFPQSISVAKTNCKETADTQAGIKDYITSLKALEKSHVADFYTINISCPNTFGGEPFTDPIRLNKLLNAIDKLKIKKPIFIKMPINKQWKEFKHLLDIAVKHNITGVVIGNLQKDHKDPAIFDMIPPNIKGGISGKPTQKLCDSLISKTYKAYGGKLIIIGAGGVFSTEDAWEKIRKGASLVQLITGMIFNGPALIAQINEGLARRLKKEGYSSIQDLVGSAHRGD